MSISVDQIYLSDGGKLDNIAAILKERSFNVETLFFAMPEHLNDNLEDHRQKFEKRFLETEAKKLSMHGPFFDLSLVSREKDIVTLTRRRYRQAVDIALKTGIEKIVFHTQYNPLLGFEAYKKEWLENSIGFFTELIGKIGDSPITLLLENMFESDPELMFQLLEAINSPHMRVCLDVGHVQVYSDLPHSHWIERLSSYIKYIHLSDNGGKIDDHLALGQGVVDFPGIFRLLEKHGVKPDFCVEMNCEENHRLSLEYLDIIKMVDFD